MPKIHIPVIGYQQGGRQMLVTAMSPVDLVRMVSKPEAWDPVKTSVHGNRPRDPKHLQGIVKYLVEEEHFVLGAAVLYLTSKEASFTPAELPGVTTESDAAKIGTLSVDIGAKFDIGDGQHRIGAHEHIVSTRDDDDPVLDRLARSGQPMIIVIEDSPKRRAQDFTDLQRNVKTPTASLAQSMDRRQPINRELSELFEVVPLFNDRVEYFKDNPGKLSSKLFSFKTVRYVSGLLLVGNGYRSPATMDKAVNAKFEGLIDSNADGAREKLIEFWTALGELVRFADIVDGEIKAPELREATYLTSAGVLYAIAFAVYQANTGLKIPITDAVRALDKVSFDRTPKTADITTEDTVFAGNLIDPETGKLQAGRTAWETAAAVLLTVICEDPHINELLEARGLSKEDEEVDQLASESA
ncbi:DNA sulfur modification protein DndB [Actinomadura xylanilytica]|uniref:DNA sulfur modification protein DndB n=1 Tax=Actinomadura xylanilytica TaxID=887459 RepID=UPI00255ABC31|nr:DNA sulfur modification protein DndB [Actinomadura xylanilytica]MDL4771331.1 DNA sulfur modification protein DndB [Actinomadura xylanilytica]